MMAPRIRVAALVVVGFALLLPRMIEAAGPLGLVSHWRAEGNPSDELGANDGSEVGTVAYAAAADGQGFSFAGAGYVDVAAPTFNAYASAFTVSAWMTMTAYSQPASLVNHRTAGNDMGFTLEQLFANPGTIAFYVNQSGTGNFNGISAPGWELNRLYHVAATFDSATGAMVLYRDGKAVAWRNDLPKTPMATKASPAFQIGHNIVAGNFWNGLIDDVRFYGTALSPADVASLVTPSTLVAHYPFDELAGTVAHDTTGQFDGTLAGGAAFVTGGISGNCISLDKATSSLVNMGTSFPGFTTGDFSVVIWVNTTDTTNNHQAIAKHESGSSNGWFVSINPTGGGGQTTKATFYVSELVAQSPTSASPVTDGQWHQIAGVYSAGGQHMIYVDGAPAESSTASIAVVSNGAPFLVGGVNTAGIPLGNYTGLVDEVQVYGSALTDPQIAYLFGHPGRVLPTVQYDLATDWSDANNPNGTWIYREGANALPHVAAWEMGTGSYSSPQPGWARSENGTDRIPFWYRSLGAETLVTDIQAGDVICHSTDGANGIGNGNGNVVWTSPFDGKVDVSGAVWMGREIGRGNGWFVYHNATLLTQGQVASGDAFDRAHPMVLTSGTGGAAALQDIGVATGDLIRFELAKSSTFGDYTGVSLSVSQPVPPTPTATVTPTPTVTASPTEETVLSYFLPKSLKLKLAGAGKDLLALAGSFDDGNLPADLTQPVTIEVAGFSRTVSLTAKGPEAFAFKDATFSMVVKTHVKGSSRGSFKMKLGKATLAGVIDPAATIALHFRASGLPDALGIVKLTAGAFKLGKVRGDLVAPAFFPAKAVVAANDGKPDALAFSGGFGNAGTTPAVLGDVHIALGDTFEQTIAGSAFTRKGNVFSHSEKGAGTALSVNLDFGRGILKVKAKGFEVGTFAAPTADFVVYVGGSTRPVRATVRLGGSGAKRVY